MKNDKTLRDALGDGYRDIDQLRILVKDRLDVRMQDVVGVNRGNAAVIFDLMEWCEAEGRLGELMWAAYEGRPGNPKLRALFGSRTSPYAPRAFGLADWNRMTAETDGGLERIVLKDVPFEDALPWLDRMARVCRAVCRIEPQPIARGKVGYATGFLVADDVIMTNCHVVEGFAGADPREVRARFDYATDAGGVATSAGRAVALHPDWDLLRSPVDRLDFALVRLAEPVGADAVAGGARGVLRLREHDFVVGAPLLIVQHPDAAPLKLALGSVLDPDPEPDRVAYSANTLPGSSGSPCLDGALEPVALHRYGGARDNRGVRFGAIRAHLRSAEARARLVAAGLAALVD